MNDGNDVSNLLHLILAELRQISADLSSLVGLTMLDGDNQ